MAFKAPEPEPYERYEFYLARLAAAFEKWVNANYPQKEN